MTRADYIHKLLQSYCLIATLSEKNGGTVLHLRNNTTEKDLVLRSYPAYFEAYDRLCGIRCENLPEIYDVFRAQDGQIILEEFVDGITVAQVMETGRYRYRGAKNVLSGVCNALSALHRQKIIHRDVKPENVMISSRGKVILIDLNASRIDTGVHRDTVIMGTVGYASPEQLGIAQSDARTDIYAAGILLNVMLTGKHPAESLVRGRAARIVRKCTSLNPDDRYQSADQLFDAL